MNRVLGFGRVIRNNWKKSVFFSGLAVFGATVVVDRLRVRHLMRAYCEEAAVFGNKPLGPLSLPRHVTVILNPEASKRKAKVKFEKYVAPILHCAGLKVSVVTSEAKGQSHDLMNIMSDTDAVVIAGGDGTLHESVTGMLSRSDGARFPLGIIPLGTINSSIRSVHGSVPRTGSKTMRDVKAIADATMSVVKETVKQIDVLKVDSNEKTVYAIGGMNFGLIRDVLSQAEKYWYLGNRMKPYLAMSSSVTWRRFEDLASDRSIQIQYTDPCTGCSRCFVPDPVVVVDKPIEIKRWWSAFVPRPKLLPAVETKSNSLPDYSSIDNPECSVWHQLNKRESDDYPINLIVRNNGAGHSGELYLHKSDSESLSKGSLILDAADVRNGSPPKDATETIKFKDLRISASPLSSVIESNDKSGELVVDDLLSTSQGTAEKAVDETASSPESGKSAPKPKFSTVNIDNEEYPMTDMSITRIRRAITVYSLPYPLFRL